MVAASRLARAQRSMTDAKAYGAANQAVFEQSDAAHSEAKIEKILYVVTSSDRGLCGGIHSSVAKFARKDILEGEGLGKDVSRFHFIPQLALVARLTRLPLSQITIVALGEKPKQQLSRGGPTADNMALSFNQIGRSVPTFADALAIADKIESEGYEFDKLKVVHNAFVSVIAYESRSIDIYSSKALSASPSFAAYEVEGAELAADLESFAMANAIYAGLVEGYAAEVSARRNAMENASKNAEE